MKKQLNFNTEHVNKNYGSILYENKNKNKNPSK